MFIYELTTKDPFTGTETSKTIPIQLDSIQLTTKDPFTGTETYRLILLVRLELN